MPNEIIDYNGLGSANIHLESSILLSIGTPEAHNHEIAILAQNRDSMYGKIIEISKNELPTGSPFCIIFNDNNLIDSYYLN